MNSNVETERCQTAGDTDLLINTYQDRSVGKGVAGTSKQESQMPPPPLHSRLQSTCYNALELSDFVLETL